MDSTLNDTFVEDRPAKMPRTGVHGDMNARLFQHGQEVFP